MFAPAEQQEIERAQSLIANQRGNGVSIRLLSAWALKVCVSPRLTFWLRAEMFRVRPGKLPTDWEREELKK